MTLTQSSINRINDIGGSNIKTFVDSGGKHIQGVVVTDDTGAQSFIPTNPGVVTLSTPGVQGRGYIPVSPDARVFSRTFKERVDNRVFCFDLPNNTTTGATAQWIDDTKEALFLRCGAVDEARAAFLSQHAIPVVPGYGQTIIFDISMDGIAIPVTGVERRFGLGDTTNGIFIEWVGADSKIKLIAYAGGSATTVNGESFDVPVAFDAGAGLLSEKIQSWAFKYDYHGRSVAVYLDGVLVHTMVASGSAPLTQLRDLRMRVEVNNTGAHASSNQIWIHAVSVFIEGSGHPWSGADRYFAHIPKLEIDATSASIYRCPIHLRNRTLIDNGQRVITATRAIHLRRMRISCTIVPADFVRAFCWSLMKGIKGDTGGTNYVIANGKKPMDADDLISGITGGATQTYLQGAVTTDNATGPGFGDGDSVVYKITALGSIGETDEGSYVTSSVAVGTPAKQVSVTIEEPNPYAMAYRVYRQVNGSGTFDQIADVDPQAINRGVFVDDALPANATVNPPGSSGADHYSFGEARYFEDLINFSGGMPIISGRFNSAGLSVQEYSFERGDIVIGPGESVALVSLEQDTGAVYTIDATMEWEDDA